MKPWNAVVRRAIKAAVLIAACGVAAGTASSAPVAPGRPSAAVQRPAAPYLAPVLTIGDLSVRWCPEVRTYCGTMRRPFDPAGIVAGDIEIYFEYYPRQDQTTASQGLLVAVEGGPGYPSSGSRSLYIPLYGPLMKNRELLLMDNRGTGRSQVIDCRVQRAPSLTQWNVAECGRQLGDTAPLYSGLYSADDLAALLTALRAPKVDLYGDSYGTYFSQTFAHRYPQWLRTIVLDSAYPVPMVGGETAWYPTFVPAMRDKYNLVCARSPGCRDLPGTSMQHIQPAIDQLRAAPFEALAFDADGRARVFTADATQMATMMLAGAPAYATARETDAAARAFVQGDQAPLLRLMAETIAAADSRGYGVRYFSTGAYLAVNCQDVAQIYDMTLPPPQRKRQRDAVVIEQQRNNPDVYAPFTIAEFRAMPLDYSLLDACVGWPAPPPQHPPGPYVPPNPKMPDVPVLVLAGELDDITTPAEGRIVAGLFPQSSYVLVANTFHVAVGPSVFDPCAAGITRRFIETGSAGDTGCAARVAPLRTPPQFVRRVAELAPATARPGNHATEDDRRAVAAAVHTLGDAVARYESNTTGLGFGLRGGVFTIENKGVVQRFDFAGTRWADDLAISGNLLWPAYRGSAEARITLTGPLGLEGRLRVHWTEGEAETSATVDGIIGGRVVRAVMPAP